MDFRFLIFLVVPAGLIAYMYLESKGGKVIPKRNKTIYIAIAVIVPIVVAWLVLQETVINNVMYGFKTEVLDEVSTVDWSNAEQLKNWGFNDGDGDGSYTIIEKSGNNYSSHTYLYIKVSKDENTADLESKYKDIQYTSKGYATYAIMPVEVSRLYFISIDGMLIEAHEKYSVGVVDGPFENFVKKLKYKK